MRVALSLVVLLASAGCGAVLTNQRGYRVFIDDEARASPCVQAAQSKRERCDTSCVEADLLHKSACGRTCKDTFDRDARDCPGVHVIRG